MTNSAWTMVGLGLVILGTACSPPRAATDSGISFPDGGVQPDTGGGSDSGGGGGCTLTIEPGAFGALSAACLPRCSMATATAVMGCGTDGTCAGMALQADMTASVPITVNGTANTLDCATCFQLAQLHCFSAVCPAEVDGVAGTCLAGGTMAECTTATNTLNGCLMALTAAQQGPVMTCLNSAQGPGGCF